MSHREWLNDSKRNRIFFFSTFWPQGVNPYSQELMAGVLFSSRATAKFASLPGAMAVMEIEDEKPVNAKGERKSQLQSLLLSACKEITYRFLQISTILSLQHSV